MQTHETVRVLVFAGSTRSQSLNKQLAQLAADALRQAGAEVTQVNLCNHPLPLYDADLEAAEGLPDNALLLKQMLHDHDALVIASPEHNASITAMLKSVIDWVSRPAPGERPTASLRGKAAAIVSASPGGGGGSRGLNHLRDILQAMGVRVVPEQVAVPQATLESLQSPSEELQARLREMAAGLLGAAVPSVV